MEYIKSLITILSLLCFSIIFNSTDVLASTFNPIEDSYVYSGASSTNYGSEEQIATGDSISGNFNHVWDSYLKFDLQSIPHSESISQANLNLYLFLGVGESGVNVYYLSDDSWAESTITWDTNPPTPGGSDIPIGNTTAYYSASVGSTWVSIELDLQGIWETDTNDYLTLYLEEIPYPNGSTHNFRSMDYTDSDYHPYLQIETTAIPIPGAVWLLGTGFIGLVGLRKRFKKS
jgi:hypothetical protein